MFVVIRREGYAQLPHLDCFCNQLEALQMVVMRMTIDNRVQLFYAQFLQHSGYAARLVCRGTVHQNRMTARAQEHRVRVQYLRENDFQQVSIRGESKFRLCVGIGDLVNDPRFLFGTGREREEQ